MAARTVLILLWVGWFAWMAGVVRADTINAGTGYTGRVVYRATRAGVPGVLVEAVEAGAGGKPSDDVLGSTRADAAGRFTLVLTKSTNKRLTLAAFAVRTSAATGGDRRGEGFEVQSHRVPLGYLPDPNPTRPNTIAIERRRPAYGSDGNGD